MWDMVGVGMLVAAIVAFTAWRHWLTRKPTDTSEQDPPGIRSIAMFTADSPELLADDDPEDLLVGTRLFTRICEALTEQGVCVASRGRIQNAHRAICESDGRRHALVLEWLDPNWALSVEWAPANARQRRHQEATHAVYAADDSPSLRQLLQNVHAMLRDDPLIRDVSWHRRHDWSLENWDAGQREPLDGPDDEVA